MPTIQNATSSPEQTLAFGRRLSAILASGDVLCLYGPLGSGKTCLVQGICQGLGAQERAVSPSFTIINEYQGRLPVYHFDCYRLERPEELDQVGFDDYLGMGGVVIIEWAERAEGRLPDERLDISIRRLGPEEREFRLLGVGKRWDGVLDPTSSPPPSKSANGQSSGQALEGREKGRVL